MRPAMLNRFLAALMLMTAASVFGAGQDAPPITIGMIEGMSGTFANDGAAVVRNLEFAIEQVNARGGVKLPGARRKLALSIFDHKQNPDESLAHFKHLTERHIPFLVQGNSSTIALALVGAVNRHNARVPGRRVLFLNYAAIDPALTNEKCSYWHFRFDAHADMRMHALTDAIRDDPAARRIYLIGQDDRFGRQVAKAARKQLAAKRQDIEIVGDDLNPADMNADFSSHIEKIKISGADTVITASRGHDLTLLVSAAKDAGLNLKFYALHANGLGAPAAIGSVRTVAEWHPNVGGSAANRSSDAFYSAFRARYPEPGNDAIYLRMHLMIEMLVAAIEKARTTEAAAVARALQGATFQNGFHHATMRAADHQLIQPLYVSVMQNAGDDGVRFDIEGSGYGFKTERYIAESSTALPTACRMVKPAK